ncbi:MAG: hypothetical protein C0469_04450, partial [Cyanobacteria bacterium DS2.3.42]|nr:hypothetical protein [Cyanobacteria bacterium DS2.3.42]
MKVLIAVDDSQCSEAVVDSAVKRNWPEQTHFLILTVLEPIPLDVKNQKELHALIEEGTEKRRKTAKELVESVAAKLKHKSSAKAGSVESTVKEG